MNRYRLCTVLAGGFLTIATSSAMGQQTVSVYTSFDAEKTCKHRAGREVEDYGSWVCPGYGGSIVYLTAGDQRMQVSFGANPRAAAREKAASETFPGFNSVYEGTVEWRIENRPGRKPRPFATILRWNTRTDADAERDDGKSSGRTLVVTRLNPGGVCHVGYVDGRAPDANELARKIADERARKFKCGADSPDGRGQKGAGLSPRMLAH